ncbi:MAG: hypothetical protein R3C10_00650 [Pirellulales bacterium]
MTDTGVLASTAGMTQAPAYHTASTAGIYPSAGGYTNPVASVPQSYTSPQSYTATPGTDSSYAATTSPAPNYAGTYGTSTPPAYGAAPTANPYTQPSYAPTMPGYDAGAMTAQATTVPQYGATQGYGVSATPTSTAPQTAAGPYGAGSYSYGTVGSATDTVASAAGMPGTGGYAGTGYETTAAPVGGATAYAPAANGYSPATSVTSRVRTVISLECADVPIASRLPVPSTRPVVPDRLRIGRAAQVTAHLERRRFQPAAAGGGSVTPRRLRHAQLTIRMRGVTSTWRPRSTRSNMG